MLENLFDLIDFVSVHKTSPLVSIFLKKPLIHEGHEVTRSNSKPHPVFFAFLRVLRG